jgi:hypothetical protein
LTKTYTASDNKLLHYVIAFIGNIEEEYVCLDNASHGLFITTAENQKWHRRATNPRIDKGTEKRILREFHKADFTIRNPELTMAETKNFYFRLYTEDLADDIIWVEPKDTTPTFSDPF